MTARQQLDLAIRVENGGYLRRTIPPMHILILKNRGILGWLISANAIGFKTHALLLGYLSGPVGALRQRLRNVASILSVPVTRIPFVPHRYAKAA